MSERGTWLHYTAEGTFRVPCDGSPPVLVSRGHRLQGRIEVLGPAGASVRFRPERSVDGKDWWCDDRWIVCEALGLRYLPLGPRGIVPSYQRLVVSMDGGERATVRVSLDVESADRGPQTTEDDER